VSVIERRSVVDGEGRGLRVIAVVNQKGGTGKSTTAANLPVALSAAPLLRKVLVLDRQTNVSMMLGHNTSDGPASMSDLFTGRPLRECVLTDVLQPGLSLVVGDPRLADLEFNLGSARRREEVLARQLARPA
jgi:chromosome partitioning protein